MFHGRTAPRTEVQSVFIHPFNPPSDLPHALGPLRLEPFECNIPMYASRAFIQPKPVLAQIFFQRNSESFDLSTQDL